jgi:outer membrane lipoprotein-sorting protein
MDGSGAGRQGRVMGRRVFLFLFLAVSCAAADLGREIAERHAQRSEGRARELKSLYAEGRTLVQGEVIDFKLWAASPNQLRVESTSPTRRIVQIFDGRHEPVIQHSDVEGGRPLRMALAERQDFIANADFSGPLVDYALKGNTVDYAGRDELPEGPAAKLLVMSPRDDVLFLWVDEKTAEIVKRSVFRIIRDQRFSVETFFSDFRPVAGTMQPFRVETKLGAKQLYLMVITRMEGNSSEVTPERFAVPTDWPKLPFEVNTTGETPSPVVPPRQP